MQQSIGPVGIVSASASPSLEKDTALPLSEHGRGGRNTNSFQDPVNLWEQASILRRQHFIHDSLYGQEQNPTGLQRACPVAKPSTGETSEPDSDLVLGYLLCTRLSTI